MKVAMTPSVSEIYVPQYAPPVPYKTYTKALELACYFQNRYVETLEQLIHDREIIEMFCLDAVQKEQG